MYIDIDIGLYFCVQIFGAETRIHTGASQALPQLCRG